MEIYSVRYGRNIACVDSARCCCKFRWKWLLRWRRRLRWGSGGRLQWRRGWIRWKLVGMYLPPNISFSSCFYAVSWPLGLDVVQGLIGTLLGAASSALNIAASPEKTKLRFRLARGRISNVADAVGTLWRTVAPIRREYLPEDEVLSSSYRDRFDMQSHRTRVPQVWLDAIALQWTACTLANRESIGDTGCSRYTFALGASQVLFYCT